MKPMLLDLFHRHIGMAFDRQVRFADLVEERGIASGWNYSVPSAELTLGGTLTYSAPLLGSHAEHNNSWLWAWNNSHLQLPLGGKRLATRVKKLSSKTGVDVFAAEEEVDCEKLFGKELSEQATHAMGAVVCGLLGHDAYYTIPYEGGRALAVFREKALRKPKPYPTEWFASRFTQLISALPVPNPKAAFVGYATDSGMNLTTTGRSLRATLPQVGDLLAKFDRQNRLVKLEYEVAPRKRPGRTASSLRKPPPK